MSERTRINFEAAMKEGMLWIRNGNTFFLGPGGSGKTHTLHSLLEEDPPAIRDSTACAKKPIRAVAQFKVGVRGTARFIRITDDQYSEMLANSAEHFSAVPKSVALTEASQPLSSEKAVMLPSSSTIQIAETPSKSSSPTEIEKVPKQSSVENQLPVAEFGLRRELQCRMQAKSKTSELLDDKDLMDVKDSGGQPMFHEVLPVFVTNTMFGILTVKLNESLDSCPLVEYYISGRRIGEPFKSPFTHLQTFRHCLRVLQSTCDPDACPKIVFVGTHKDLERECHHEDRKEKNRKLQSIIPPEMKDNIIYNGESLLFCINAKTPGNDDRKLMGSLRQRMIKELQMVPKKKIPLRYFSLENAFQRLAKYQRRAVLSIDECLKEATAYHFTRESLDDVLQYLHNLKLIMYYKDILPDVVFIDAQVLLDKITELVEYSIELRAKPSSQAVAAGSLEKFKTCGIVTTEILSQFTSGYVPGLFEEKHLILVFKKLLIVAEIGKGKFLMPCLLEEEMVRISSRLQLVIPALVFYFGENGPKLGVYCFLLASLITDAKWKLLTENGTPVQLSRNRVRFAVPGNNPGCITITDSFSTFFHVSIEFPNEITETKALEICEDVCPTIRETILTHIRRASHRLNYNNSIPEAAFLCSKCHSSFSRVRSKSWVEPGEEASSKDDETAPPHPATISKCELLTCTMCPRSVFCTMTEKHALWLGKATSSSSDHDIIPPIEGELNMKDLCEVQRATWDARRQWYNIGLELHIDPGTLDVIEGNNKDINNCFRAMLTTWLKMVEPKPTWETLAEALRSPPVGFEHLAERCVMPPIKKARLS